MKEFQNHIPARGRKHIRCAVFGFSILYFKTISPQGDGNTCSSHCSTVKSLKISKPYPRKGTETLSCCHDTASGRKHFKTISPQGDGNLNEICHCDFCFLFQNHIPARGRKHAPHCRGSQGHYLISKPYPRKGTETFQQHALLTISKTISKPYPRKGTETTCSTRK